MAAPSVRIVPLLSLLFFVERISAHGYVDWVGIDNSTYTGNPPGHYINASATRMVSSVSPVQDLANPDLACGPGAVPAQLDALAQPGSQLKFHWATGSGGNWFHQTGPIMTYMASCGAPTCSNFNTADARWFKIAQAGRHDDNSSWVQGDLTNGAPYVTNIPDVLEPGAYLIRNEIISLQNAMGVGGAEFYPSCTQVVLSGNGTSVPASNVIVTLPGAYNPTDPGIHIDVYSDSSAPYIFPGPPIATLVPQDGNSTSSDNAPGVNSTSSSVAPAATSTFSGGTPGGTSTPSGVAAVAAAPTDPGVPSSPAPVSSQDPAAAATQSTSATNSEWTGPPGHAIMPVQTAGNTPPSNEQGVPPPALADTNPPVGSSSADTSSPSASTNPSMECSSAGYRNPTSQMDADRPDALAAAQHTGLDAAVSTQVRNYARSTPQENLISTRRSHNVMMIRRRRRHRLGFLH